MNKNYIVEGKYKNRKDGAWHGADQHLVCDK